VRGYVTFVIIYKALGLDGGCEGHAPGIIDSVFICPALRREKRFPLRRLELSQVGRGFLVFFAELLLKLSLALASPEHRRDVVAKHHTIQGFLEHRSPSRSISYGRLSIIF